MKTNLLTLLLSLTLFTGSYGETNTNESPKGEHFVGAHAGSTTGLGFSYRYTHGKFGIQLTGIPTFNREEFYHSVGLAATYRIKKDEDDIKRFTFLTYAGASFTFQKSWTSVLLQEVNQYDYGLHIERRYALSVGFGLETKVSDRLILTTLAGYGMYVNNNVATNVAGEVGLHYRL